MTYSQRVKQYQLNKWNRNYSARQLSQGVGDAAYNAGNIRGSYAGDAYKQGMVPIQQEYKAANEAVAAYRTGGVAKKKLTKPIAKYTNPKLSDYVTDPYLNPGVNVQNQIEAYNTAKKLFDDWKDSPDYDVYIADLSAYRAAGGK